MAKPIKTVKPKSRAKSKKKFRPGGKLGLSSRTKWIFVIAFAALGAYLTYITLAATTTVTYQGTVASTSSPVNYSLTTGTGEIKATLKAKSRDVVLTIKDQAGTVKGTVTSSGKRRGDSLTLPNMPSGLYSFTVSTTSDTGQQKTYTLSITYTLKDATKPTAVITSPQSSATVNGTVNFSATATDDVGVTKVEFFVGTTLLATDTTAPYSAAWDTTKVANASIGLTVKSYDAVGNIGQASIPVTVYNAATPPPTPSGWELLYEDNFDGSANGTTSAPTLNTTVLDLANKKSYWKPYTSAGHAGNGLRRPSAFTLENGNLVITAKSVLQSDGTKKTVSGGMSNETDTIYGRFEARVRVENDPTGTMSGLVLTWPEAQNNCLNGELDFFETGTATTRQPFYSYMHFPTADQICTPTPQKQFIHNSDGTRWHKVVMEWTPNSINVKVYDNPTGADGKPGTETLISDNTLVEDSTDKIPDVLHHLCIQLDAFKSTPLPDNVVVRQYVDYVRHYKKI